MTINTFEYKIHSHWIFSINWSMNLLPAKPSSKHFISEWHLKILSLMVRHFILNHAQGNMCRLTFVDSFGILSMLIFIDFLDPIIYEFKSSTKNERVLNIPTLKLWSWLINQVVITVSHWLGLFQPSVFKLILNDLDFTGW